MSDTDRNLKDKLNTNQAARERMCIEILGVQPKFSDVRPRLPKGGPDGGRDIEAAYEDSDRVLGAVGFVNDATDTDQHRKDAKNKFLDDLAKIGDIPPDDRGRTPKVFVFFTNVGLTPGIVDELKKAAYEKSVSVCEIFDRERLRLALDSSSGYGIRLRYLDIPLSDAEQKEFFAAWGDKIQSVMASRLSEIDALGKRLNFLSEAQFPVDYLAVGVKLDAPLGDISGGDFVFQASLMLRTHADGLMYMTFGSASEPVVETIDQIRSSAPHHPRNGQIGFAFAYLIPGSPQHESFKEIYGEGEGDDVEKWFQVGSSSGILEIDKTYLRAEYCSEPFLMRWHPTCKLIDLHHCTLLFDCGAAVAEHIEEIFVSANQYRLLHLRKGDFRIKQGNFSRLHLPKDVHQTEDFDEWRIIRPVDMVSGFSPDFMSATPERWLPLDEPAGTRGTR